jgi:hypothetical protein
MSRRAAALLAWFAGALSLALTLLSLVFLILNLSHPDVPVYSFWIENVLFSVGFSTVGAVIVPRLPPENRTGWLFCAIGLLWAVAHSAAEYAIYALLVAPGSLPAGEAVSWFFTWPPITALGLMLFLVLLFPDGRLPGDGWRWFARLGALATVVAATLQAITPGPIGAGLPIRNPFGFEGFPNVGRPVQALMFALISAAVVSLFVRRSRASEVERLQIRWFAYAFAVASCGVILKYLVAEPLDLTWLGRFGYALDLIGTAGIPISMGIAILRYRLYDIDLVINRTLVYGALTLMLALVYFGGVATTQAVFRVLTGQERLPQLAVVASTLAIAALFDPLRRRVQRFIDRRFYRRKYDARETLEAFSSRLRNETDLDALNADLLELVRETMQPAHVSMWLRPEPTAEEQVAWRP